MSTATVKKIHEAPYTPQNGQGSRDAMQETAQGWVRHFWPSPERMRMTQEARGVFIPYPLLGILLTLTILVITGIIAVEVQVSNLNTTLLLRDADQRAQIHDLQEKAAQLEVYIHSDREKLIKIETQLDKATRTR